MAAPARARKLAERIQVIVAQMLETRVKDPRLGFVTITDARVTNDLQSATIFYTVYGDDADRAGTAAALESAKGVLRSEVGRQTGVRHTPTLAFVADGVPDTARHIQELLETAAQRDAEVHRVAAAASYAGAPDPYRAPVTDTVDAREPGDARAPGDASGQGDAVEGDSDGFRSALGGGRPD